MKNIFIYLCIISCLLANCNETGELEIFNNYEQGLQEAKRVKILLMFDWWGNPTNSTIRLLEDKDIKKAIREYTLVLLMVDDKQLDKNTSETKGKLNFEIQRNVYKTKNQPIYFITDGNGTILKGPKGYCKKEEFIDFVQF